MTSKFTGWRVVYGETMPVWEQAFRTKRAADTFAKKHRSFGDVIFSIARITGTEMRGPLSMMAETEEATP